MHDERTIREVMSDDIRTIHPNDAIDTTLRRLSHDGSRSVIVTNGGVPVGVFDAVTVACRGDENDGQVEDVMLRDLPSLTEDMTLGEASDRSIAADTDRLPVVNGDGFLVGELARADLVADSRAGLEPPEGPARKPEPKVIDANNPASVLSDAEPGMIVVTTDGIKVGVVAQVHIGDDQDTWLAVEHGMLAKKRTIVNGDLVDLVDEDVAILSIDQATFKQLPVR